MAEVMEILTIPLWNFDRETVHTIGKAYEFNEFIATLRIVDSIGDEFFTIAHPEHASVVSRIRDVGHKGDIVGHVALSLTAAYYTAIQRQFFWSYSLSILLMVGVLLVGTNALLRLFLKQPLRHFTDVVNAYAGGNAEAFTQTMPYIELQPFTGVLQKMGETISAQIRVLQQAEQKYRSIFENASEGIYRTSPVRFP